MKTKYLFLILSIGCTSCTDYYFDHPLPIDAKNRYTVPKKMTGAWYIVKKGDVDFHDFDSIYIGKNYYHYISRNTSKISLDEIREDSTAFFNNERIYVIDNDKITGEYDYTTAGDSLVTYELDENLVELGQKVFLRKIEYGYILNQQEDENLDWWTIQFIDTQNKDRIIVRRMGKNDDELFHAYKLLNKDLPHYFQVKWTSDDILKFIDNGGFSDTILVLKYNEKLKK